MSNVLYLALSAVLASLGTVGAQSWLGVRRDRQALKEIHSKLVQRHLLLLQDAVDSLSRRLRNLEHRDGLSAMEASYYAETTLYALGVVLAQKRRTLLDGVYKQLDDLEPRSGDRLLRRLEVVESSLGRGGRASERFPRYERQVLGEAVLERSADGWSVVPFLTFRQRYRSDEEFSGALTAAKDFVTELQATDSSALRESLDRVGRLLAPLTSIPYQESGDGSGQ